MLPLLRSAKYYLYEPDSFVPVAQALRKAPIRLLRQPDWRGREYDIDQDPLWQHEVKPQPIDAIAWYQCDYLGTPMELTDHHGEVAWAGQYKAWGDVREVRSDWAKQVGMSNPIRFQGQYHDHETGLHYNRYRYYEPRVGRFVSQDPISYGGGLNLFAYAPNPVEWIDPFGLSMCFLDNPKKKVNSAEVGDIVRTPSTHPEDFVKLRGETIRIVRRMRYGARVIRLIATSKASGRLV